MAKRVGSVLVAGLTLLLWAAPGAYGVDGVLEINQARALAGGVTAGDTAGFPVTISQAGSYRLTGNLTVPDSNTTAIVVTANGVEIDLNGFSISGPNVCSGCGSGLGCSGSGSGRGIQSLGHGVGVRNGTITGMGSFGIEVQGAFVAMHAVHVDNVTVAGNAGGIIIDDYNEAVITGSRVLSNADYGILIHDYSVSAVITGNAVKCNRMDGILAYDAVISGNTVTENGGWGITGFASTVTNNVVRLNSSFYGGQIYLSAASPPTGNGTGTLIGNTVVGILDHTVLDLGSNVGWSNNVLVNLTNCSIKGGHEMGPNVCDGVVSNPLWEHGPSICGWCVL